MYHYLAFLGRGLLVTSERVQTCKPRSEVWELMNVRQFHASKKAHIFIPKLTFY